MEQQADLVQAMRRALVEPVALLVTAGKDGRANVMSAGWNMKVSYAPPLIAVGVGETRHSLELLQQNDEFVLAFMSTGAEELLEYFGTASGRDEDKLAKTGTKTLPATKVGVPLLADARLNFECKVHSITKPGDHYIVVGEILAAHLDESKPQMLYKGKDRDNNRTYSTVDGYED